MPRIYLSPPHMSGHELELVNGAFALNWIAPLGPHVDAFEREAAAAVGVPHAAASPLGGGVERCDERRKVKRDHRPHDVVVDGRVAVNQSVSHADNFVAGNC